MKLSKNKKEVLEIRKNDRNTKIHQTSWKISLKISPEKKIKVKKKRKIEEQK